MTAATEEPTQQIINDFVGNAHGNLPRVEELLTRYPSLLNARAVWDESALQAAAHAGSRPVAEALLAAGAPLDICTAAMLGRIDEVASLLDQDSSLAYATGAHGIPVLYHAVITGQGEVARLLVECGSDVQAGEGGNTALHGAARAGQTAMVEWLLAQGANPNALDYEGKTPLTVALEADHSDVADLLREHGAHA